MSLDTTAPEVAFAVNIVRKSAQMAQRVLSGMALINLTKSDFSPVTVSDFALQAITSKALLETFPNEPLVAEEVSDELRRNAGVLDAVLQFVRKELPDATEDDVCGWIDRGAGDPAPRCWVMDPIDGTKGYLRGGQYAVALALLQDGQVQMGVFGCPNLGEGCVPDSCGVGMLVVAVRGQGAWQTLLQDENAPFDPMRVSDCADPAAARLLRSVEAGHTNVSQIDRLVEAMSISAEPVIMDSMAKYAVLGAGNGDLLVRLLSDRQPDYREKIWDQAAGSIIVEEAGGRITDLSGKGLDFSQGRTLARNRGILATNGALHDAALETLAKVGAA
ncbi:MAG: 3'(2'),5'-bisphosphate nucleotidase [Nitrospiraceae bacterium]|nr:3'(2'),5'-bisphosphate nucleotidase [Nitrospiraceae bacterium]